MPRAAAYTYFGNRDEIKGQTFENVKHKILGRFANFRLANREFAYLPFHGQLFSIRLRFGKGSWVENADNFRTYMAGV